MSAGQTIACPHCGKLTELAIRGVPAKTGGAGYLWVGIGLSVSLVAAAVIASLAWMHRAQPETASAVSEIPTIVTNAAAVSKVAPAVVAEPQPEALTNDFAVMPFKLEKTSGSSLIYVTGTVRNMSGRQRFGVKVAFALFDGSDHAVGSATDYRPVLEPQAEWRFKAMVMASKAASAKFSSIVEDK